MANLKAILLTCTALALASPAMAAPVLVDLGHLDSEDAGCERIEVRSELPKTKGDLLYVTYRGGCAGLEQRGGSEHASLSADAGDGEDGGENGGSEAGGDTGGDKGGSDAGNGSGGSKGDGGSSGSSGGKGNSGNGKGNGGGNGTGNEGKGNSNGNSGSGNPGNGGGKPA